MHKELGMCYELLKIFDLKNMMYASEDWKILGKFLEKIMLWKSWALVERKFLRKSENRFLKKSRSFQENWFLIKLKMTWRKWISLNLNFKIESYNLENRILNFDKLFGISFEKPRVFWENRFWGKSRQIQGKSIFLRWSLKNSSKG